MGLDDLLLLLGGLGSFLFGMKYMGDGLEASAGPKMSALMEKLTRTPIRGFLLGMLVTVAIQSSSATTVMVMGFINAGILTLAQGTGVIIGANIGTTITSVLIALDISAIAPFCIFAGAVAMLYCKKNLHKHIGQVVLGFGLLFQGLHTMSGAMGGLKDVPAFQSFITTAKNPVVGLLVGVVLCAVIQSSSAAVGVLQALASQGLMPLHFASFLICGINIRLIGTAVFVGHQRRKQRQARRLRLLYLQCSGRHHLRAHHHFYPLYPNDRVHHLGAHGAGLALSHHL